MHRLSTQSIEIREACGRQSRRCPARLGDLSCDLTYLLSALLTLFFLFFYYYIKQHHLCTFSSPPKKYFSIAMMIDPVQAFAHTSSGVSPRE
jgi:hypothetical protein